MYIEKEGKAGSRELLYFYMILHAFTEFSTTDSYSIPEQYLPFLNQQFNFQPHCSETTCNAFGLLCVTFQDTYTYAC